MRLFRHYAELQPKPHGCVVAIGNFDGVHLGHQAVIMAAKRMAEEARMQHAVMTFEPHPRRFFNPSLPPFRLTPFRAKARQIEALGIDLLIMQTFDTAFAQLTAEEFVDEVLIKRMCVRHVVIGYNFIFGKGRSGDAEFLREMGEKRGFNVTVVPRVLNAQGQQYSSTRIRDLLIAGKPLEAANLLGHYWEVEGRVEHGEARGRTIGFPTANIVLENYQRPAIGVYTVCAGIDGGPGVPTRWYHGVANFGRRPTFDGKDELLEVHLLDFAENLYGRYLRVAMIDRIRDERKFAGIEELKAQIALDVAHARQALGNAPLPPGPMVPLALDRSAQ